VCSLRTGNSDSVSAARAFGCRAGVETPMLTSGRLISSHPPPPEKPKKKKGEEIKKTSPKKGERPKRSRQRRPIQHFPTCALRLRRLTVGCDLRGSDLQHPSFAEACAAAQLQSLVQAAGRVACSASRSRRRAVRQRRDPMGARPHRRRDSRRQLRTRIMERDPSARQSTVATIWTRCAPRKACSATTSIAQRGSLCCAKICS